jgi:hypothetical protein
MLLKEKLYQNKFILIAMLVAFLIRLPGLFQELPPYQFCDEEFFFGEVSRMIGANTYLAKEFRAGGANIYPMFYLGKLINLFSPEFYRTTGLLIIGRLLLLGLMGSLNIIVLNKICELIFNNKIITQLTIVLYLVSPFILSNSRIWYPDNYIYVFSGIFFIGLVKILKSPSDYKSYFILALGLAFTISTKYTGILLIIPAIIILFSNYFYYKNFNKLLINSLFFLIIFIATISILNYSAYFYPEKFILDFNSNRNLYKNNGIIDEINYLYYFNFTFTMVLGIFSFPLWGLGGYYLLKNSRYKFGYLICLSIPIIFIIFLGSMGKVLSRNVSILLPFVLPFIGCGVYYLVYKIDFLNLKIRIIIALLILVIPQGLQSIYIFYHNFYPDSRIIAKKWLKNNINNSSTVGYNDACSGSSAASVAGLRVEFDPNLKLNLDYYVLNSYWTNIFDKYYFNRYGYLRFIDQKYIHFYEYEKNEAFKFDRYESVKYAVIPGYSIIKIFKYNGPDVIVLKRND